MKNEKYRPNTEADFENWYPGKISDQRRKELTELRYNARELTADDLVYLLTQGAAGMFHTFVKAMKTVVGEDKTREILMEFGRIRGERNIARFVKAVGTNDPTPEDWAWFQDAVHCAAGIEHAQSYAEYDDEKCVVKRTHCQLLTQDPETREYCRYFHLGALAAYNEKVPTVESTLAKCMVTVPGDGHCEDVFRRKTR